MLKRSWGIFYFLFEKLLDFTWLLDSYLNFLDVSWLLFHRHKTFESSIRPKNLKHYLYF